MSEQRRLGSFDQSNPAFEDFMKRYWHKMADALYANLGSALIEFKNENGEAAFFRLIEEIEQLKTDGRFPKLAEIRGAHSDPFWEPFDRIITVEELDAGFACEYESGKLN